jgi:hypothetical protein
MLIACHLYPYARDFPDIDELDKRLGVSVLPTVGAVILGRCGVDQSERGLR